MLPPLLTLALLAGALMCGYRIRTIRVALAVLVPAWLAVMVASFVIAGVADDADIVAFVLSAVVILGLVVVLAWLGTRLSARARRAS